MNEKFAAGDQVRLKSGGPYMTVDRIISDQVFCMWFDDGDLKQAAFGEALLITRDDYTAAVAHRRSSAQKNYY